jgi:hypothetical protein
VETATSGQAFYGSAAAAKDFGRLSDCPEAAPDDRRRSPAGRQYPLPLLRRYSLVAFDQKLDRVEQILSHS